ncbi:MAG: protease complex subunit PrcB family protein [Lachnospiraceae bacterium]|jgi:hypothetical protein|nr:protease complex subunit PrcB family protein [Lachnospiraceae bacterium]
MKMRMRRRRQSIWMLCLIPVFLLAGCGKGSGAGDREALDYEVVTQEEIPPELKTIIEEKKQAEFKLTYTCDGFLYLVTGLGQQESGGYSISVKDLYLQGGSICLETESMGPTKEEAASKSPSCPYLVLKLQYREEPVVFL